jgi:hypothetical protein
MICRDHDLSIYIANFKESENKISNEPDSLVWEGQGLMSWIMNQSSQDIKVLGKTNSADKHIDVYVELQPVSKYKIKYANTNIIS